MANVLVFGDSIAYGDYDKYGGWVDRLKILLKNKFIEGKSAVDINTFNLSISGETTSGLIDRLSKEVPQRCWAGHKIIIIFAIGINDAIVVGGSEKTHESLFKKNIIKIINVSKAFTDNLIFTGLTPVDESKVTPMPWSPEESYFNKRIKEYNNIIKTLCRKNNLDFIDLYSAFSKLNYKELLLDGVHPNTKGHEKIFSIVKEVFK